MQLELTSVNLACDPQISPLAKDLICRLMCDVEDRLGTNGVHEIKVRVQACLP